MERVDINSKIPAMKFLVFSLTRPSTSNTMYNKSCQKFQELSISSVLLKTC
jgi:hypothetical protein